MDYVYRGLFVRVTKQDIANGKRRRKQECPIALAAYRDLVTYCERPGCYAHVTRKYLRIGIDPSPTGRTVREQCGKLPKQATDWIVRFDKGLPVKPIKFIVEFIQ